MALINDVMEKCHIIDRTTHDDPYGGVVEGYRVGASLDAAIIKNSSTEAIVAEKQTSTEFFTVVSNKGSLLDYHTIIRRDKDNEYFQITSRQKDSEAPAQSTIQIGKVTAERWELPKGAVVDEGSSGET